MQFIDLGKQQERIRDQIDQRISDVLKRGQYINGPAVGQIEKCLAAYVGTEHAVGCASGTDALLMALMAYGIGPGDAIFTTPFTFIATAEAICLLGATPVFVDIDPQTFNIDPNRLEAAIAAVQNGDFGYPLPRSAMSPTAKSEQIVPRGIIPVDLFGLTADYDRITEIAQRSGQFVVEDAAQSFGADYRGRKSCSLGEISCTSFFPAKPLGCYGDGGMCFTNNSKLADLLKSIRVHGMGSDKYDNARIGINGRLDTIQAAILEAKFSIFPEEVELRRKAADRYAGLFAQKLGTSSPLQLQRVQDGYASVWAQYSILARDQQHRTVIQEALKRVGIPSAVYYPKPLHLQTVFAPCRYRQGDFPVSEDYASRIFSIPMHPYLQPEDQERIVETICSVCR